MGSFVFANGVCSPQADGSQLKISRRRKGTLRAIAPLILLGATSSTCPPVLNAHFTIAAGSTARSGASLAQLHAGLARLAMTKLVGYQEHVSEYGEHWNFFFTLAAVASLTAVVRLPPTALLPAGAIVLAAHQVRPLTPGQRAGKSNRPGVSLYMQPRMCRCQAHHLYKAPPLRLTSDLHRPVTFLAVHTPHGMYPAHCNMRSVC